MKDTYTVLVNIEHTDEGGCQASCCDDEKHDEGLPDKLGVFDSLDKASSHLRRLSGWGDPFFCNDRDSDFRLDDGEEEVNGFYLLTRLDEEKATNEQFRAEIKELKELLDFERLAASQAREDAIVLSEGRCQQHHLFPLDKKYDGVQCYGKTFTCTKCKRTVCAGYGADDCLGGQCDSCWAESHNKILTCCPSGPRTRQGERPAPCTA